MMMRLRHVSTISLMTLAIATASATSLAAPPPPIAQATPPVDEREAESTIIFNEGVVAYTSRDWEAARSKFAAAYAKYPSPNSLYNLARTEQNMGRLLEALKHYRAYVELPENPRVSEVNRSEARQRMSEVLTKVGRIAIVAPKGAQVTVDHTAVAIHEGDPVDVEPGTHSVDIIVGVETRTRNLTCNAGEVQQANWEDERTGTLILPPPMVSTPFWNGRRVAGAVLLGGGLVVGAVGLGFGISALGAASDASSARAGLPTNACVGSASSLCGGLATNSKAAADQGNVAVVMGVVGGAVFLTGAVLLAIPNSGSKEKSKDANAASVRVLPSLGGVVMTGRF